MSTRRKYLIPLQIIETLENSLDSDMEDIEIEHEWDIKEVGDASKVIEEDENSNSDDNIGYHRPRKSTQIIESDCSSNDPTSSIQASSTQPISRRTLWHSNKDNEFNDNISVFSGVHEIKISGRTPYSYFIQIFSEDIFNHIAEETIRYAVQYGKDIFNISISEMKQFFGINIVMTYISYPNYRLYWSSNPSLRLGIIADAMPIKRFEEIKRFLHYNHEIQKECNDIFIKIRPLLNMLSKTIRYNYSDFYAFMRMSLECGCFRLVGL
ncbi:PREDICTED: piggyBac transposable element-derived protein 2-like [Dinoponera quadriceps]|uniref:PiggyBac transposable element-derived protein 2-like n=1 Tax=Dinoponera quadriceps TaxID=609295 RepID=A0A6P3Y5W6_DINQU|nr:PREDICTED: piggyBac transposable element-derived protein 2-like [Dinoponera quadriceps]